MAKETFDLLTRLEVHGDGADGMEFSGMASVFGSLVQSWMPTIIEPGAFTKTLQTDGSRIKLLLHHDTGRPVGRPIELKETRAGLFLRGRLSDTGDAKDAYTLLKDGVLDSLSIGFDPIKWEMEETENKETIRHVKEVRLWEISLVTFPADPKAVISEVHGVQFLRAPEAGEAVRREDRRIPDFSERFGSGWIF
ncbi:MAG: HK97 family phage prohead protease [Acidobacteria bacterium]|nr:HK97 family phage prohead protease [Acidobacteriota bacterium]